MKVSDEARTPTAPQQVPRFSAAILAGGAGRRLGGRDKSALAIGAASILERQRAMLRDLSADIRIIANDPARFAASGLPVRPDHFAGIGALGGLHAALADAAHDRVLVIACDMPFLTAPFLRHLLLRAPHAEAVMPRDAHGRHPLCSVYARGCAAHLEAAIHRGTRRVLDAIEGLTVHDVGPEELATFDPTGRLLTNVNTPDDYALARSTETG